MSLARLSSYVTIVCRGLGPWTGPAQPKIQTGRAGPKFKQYDPFRAWVVPGRVVRMYTYTPASSFYK
jgi:hypothetical protein